MPKIRDRAPLSKFKKKKEKADPAEVQTWGQWDRKQSPYTMNHADIAYQMDHIYNIYSVTVTVNTSPACFRRFFAINSPKKST